MDEEKLKCLYYIKDNRNSKIIYIGKTKDFNGRKYNHFNDTRTVIDLYMFNEGRENFSMFPFENIDCTNMSDEELMEKEGELIEYYNTICGGLNKRRSGNICKDINAYQRDYYHKSEKLKEYYRECSRRYRARKKAEKSANTESL